MQAWHIDNQKECGAKKRFTLIVDQFTSGRLFPLQSKSNDSEKLSESLLSSFLVKIACVMLSKQWRVAPNGERRGKSQRRGERKEGTFALFQLSPAPPFLALFCRSLLFLPSPLFKRLEQAMVKTHGRPKRIVQFTLVISRIDQHRQRRQHRKRPFLK